MLTGPNIIFALKIAVSLVTLLLIASLTALARGHYRLHGRLNIAFTVITLMAVLGFELLLRFGVEVTSHFTDADRIALWVHLGFVIPLVPVMLIMVGTGIRHRRKLHVGLGCVFLILWAGTLVTGLFYLPH
ncbi:MAG TPA: hypothetical protein PKD86_03065 [Gemmatales bacterium]|nr:hypothetical protein [Gemmatales bacterium]HMP58313.1 hypothetical protein [Gemmatales bacterium]